MTPLQGKYRKIAILGASDKPDRYSNLLIRRLQEKGQQVFPINPALATIAGIQVYPNLESLPPGVEVLTIYMNTSRSENLAEAIVASGIPKVIFNPGAENPALMRRLEERGKEVLEACSLVLSGMDQL